MALSAVGAITEGAGFVLLVPLLAMLVGSGPIAGTRDLASPGLDIAGWSPSIATLLACFAALAVLRAAAEYYRVTLSVRQVATIADTLRERAVGALLAADWRALSRMRQSDNRALLLAEIDRAALAVEQLAAATRIAIGLAALGVAALAISPLAALAGAILGGGLFVAFGQARRRARQYGEILSERYRDVITGLEENLDAMRAIKGFGAEVAVERQLATRFRALREIQLQFTADMTRMRALLQALAAVGAAALAWLALEQWGVPVAMLLPLAALFARALPQLSAFLDSWQNWSHAAPALAAAERLIGELEASAEKSVHGAATVLPPRRTIGVEQVSFAHREGVAALHAVSFDLPVGSITALIGPSGAGKSTLADILAGLLAPDSGFVALDGNPLDPAQRRGWRRQVAYVDQHPSLFDGTIRDNLLWAAPDVGEDRLRDALDRAAAGFVQDLPGGLDCPVGTGGRQLSGGERQRIVLARALLRDPALLILDEATSALDRGTDRDVAKAVAAMAGRCTVLIIGHRGALTECASRTVTLESGRIVADTGSP